MKAGKEEAVGGGGVAYKLKNMLSNLFGGGAKLDKQTLAALGSCLSFFVFFVFLQADACLRQVLFFLFYSDACLRGRFLAFFSPVLFSSAQTPCCALGSFFFVSVLVVGGA